MAVGVVGPKMKELSDVLNLINQLSAMGKERLRIERDRRAEGVRSLQFKHLRDLFIVELDNVKYNSENEYTKRWRIKNVPKSPVKPAIFSTTVCLNRICHFYYFSIL